MYLASCTVYYPDQQMHSFEVRHPHCVEPKLQPNYFYNSSNVEG